MAGKVLVVDDDAGVQRLLEHALRQEGYEVFVAGDSADALRIWQAEFPSLIVLDVTLEPADGYEVARRIRADESMGSHVPIIIITENRDVQEKVRALRSGADDHLVKPFHPAELLARIRSLTTRFAVASDAGAAQPRLGLVHAYYGAKGGAGTTTVAINTAIALQGLGRRVCLVDGNLQFGDHRVFLDLTLDKRSIVDLVGNAGIDADLAKGVLVQHESGVDLLLAPTSPEQAELVTANEMSRILELIAPLYDVVIVDIDKRLDEVNLRVLDVADAVYAVMTADLVCLKNARHMLEMMAQLGYGQEKLRLVLNRANAYTGISPKQAEGVLRKTFEAQIVNEYRGAITALNNGAPIQKAKPDSVLGRSILEFATRIHRTITPTTRAALAQR